MIGRGDCKGPLLATVIVTGQEWSREVSWESGKRDHGPGVSDLQITHTSS